MIEVNKTYEISEPEYSDRFKYAVEMFDYVSRKSKKR